MKIGARPVTSYKMDLQSRAKQSTIIIITNLERADILSYYIM